MGMLAASDFDGMSTTELKEALKTERNATRRKEIQARLAGTYVAIEESIGPEEEPVRSVQYTTEEAVAKVVAAIQRVKEAAKMANNETIMAAIQAAAQ